MVPLTGVLGKAQNFIPTFLSTIGCTLNRMLDSHSSTFYYETYDEITANLTNQQKIALEAAIAPEPNPQIYHTVISAILSGNLTPAILDIEFFHFYALRALKDDMINGMSFTTSQLFYNVYRHAVVKEAIRFIPLFLNESINPEAWEIILSSAKADSFEGRKGGRTEQEIAHFFELMRNAPSIDKQFMLFSDPITGDNTMGQLLIKEKGLKLLTEYKSNMNKTFRILPSKGMFQACLACKGGSDTPKLISRFLLSPIEQLEEEILQKKRDFCLNFACFPQTMMADGLECNLRYNEVEFHDFFHGELITSIPMSERQKITGLAQAARKLSQTSDTAELQRFFTTLMEQFIDMEECIYIAETDNSRELSFWSIMWGNIFNAFLVEDPDLSEDDCNTCFSKGAGKLFLQELIDEAEHYKKEYGIDVNELLRLRRTELNPNARLEFAYTKKMAIQANEILNSSLKNISLVKELFWMGSATNYVKRSRAWKILKTQYLPSYFTEAINS